MTLRAGTVDFGAPGHVRLACVPGRGSQAVQLGPVVIVEDYGYRGHVGRIPRGRGTGGLVASSWSGIADVRAAAEFND
jgi:hypothetical protein